MTLDKFCSGRLVVLRSDATAYEAARAMFDNHVGAVLVVEAGELAGIVTDRDLALRGGARLPLDRLPLRELMTPHPLTVERDAPVSDVVALMENRQVRRVVITDRGHPVGMVTVDDLILSPSVSRKQLEKIVLAQLKALAPAKPEGQTRPERRHSGSARPTQRSLARRSQTLHAFGRRLERITGLRDEAEALKAFEVVAVNLVRRLTPGEAKDFVAQLPASLREKLSRYARGPDRRITRDSIERDVADRLGVWPTRATEIVWRIGQAMGQLISEGELEGLRAQLPTNLKPLFRGASA